MPTKARDNKEDFGFRWRNPSGTLLYAPDFQVYVALEDGPLDLSGDIEDFVCTRNVNAVSTLQFTLNNKYRKYDQVLQRMARISMFFKRVGWVQGFAGYLNTVPYLTVVPGSVTVTASCTLKKIAYTYWDPFSAEAIMLFPGYNEQSITTPDGGAAASTFKMLTEVAGWPKEQVWIQQIPEKFITQAVKIAATAKGVNPDAAMVDQVKQLLTAYGFIGLPADGTQDGTVTQPNADQTSTSGPSHPCPPGFHPDATGQCVSDAGGNQDPSTGVETRTDPFVFFPIAGSWHYNAGAVNLDDFCAPRSGHLHDGNDLMADTGTPIVAPFAGTIADISATDDGDCGIHFYLRGQFGYVLGCHCQRLVVSNGQHVAAGDLIGYVDTTGNAAATGVSHLHFEWHPYTVLSTDKRSCNAGSSAVDPHPYLELAAGRMPSTIPGGTGIGSGSLFNTQFQYPTMEIESAVFTGDRAWINDVPLMQSITEMCQASLRDFQSAPNGDFIAWYPDKLGIYGKAPAMAIRDIEVLDLKVSISDDQLTTHVAVAGNPTLTDANTGIDPDWILTNGIVSIEQKEVMQLLLDLDTNTVWEDMADWMLPRFGMRPLRQESGNIRDHRLEFMLALHIFMQKWSEQFLAQVSLTWMPELYPGMRVILEEHGLGFYVEQVTHQGSRSSGFTTSAVLSTPMVLKDGRWRLLELERSPKAVVTPQDEERLVQRIGRSKVLP